MSEAPTYYEHSAKAPELAVVEYVPAPDAEACALRVALVRTTAERDYWRARAQNLETTIARADAAGQANYIRDESQ